MNRGKTTGQKGRRGDGKGGGEAARRRLLALAVVGLSAAEFRTHDSESSGQEQELFVMLVTRGEAQNHVLLEIKLGETECVAGREGKREEICVMGK
jgi:hypothetical protein